MSDVGADLEAVTTLVYEAQDVLSRLNPDHSLVSCLFPRSEEERNKQWQKLLRSFAKDPHTKGGVKGAMECTYALSAYLLALNEAIAKEESEAAIKSMKEKIGTTNKQYLAMLVGIRKRKMVSCQSCKNSFDPEANIPSAIAPQGLCPSCEQESLNLLANHLQQDTPGARLLFEKPK